MGTDLFKFTPRDGWSEWWQSTFDASAGHDRIDIMLYHSNSVEIVVHWFGMGQPNRTRHHLHGTWDQFSESYGWFRIERIERAQPSAPDTDEPVPINISNFEGGIIFEYFCVAKSPHHQHPSDMILMNAAYGTGAWNKHFEIFLVLHQFVEELVQGLRYIHENSCEDYEPPDMDAVEEIERIFRKLEKRKLEQVAKPSE